MIQILTGIQNTAAAFTVGAVAGYLGNAATGPAMLCQWQSAPAGSLNFTNLPGATSLTYTTPPVALTQNGARFRAALTTVGARSAPHASKTPWRMLCLL